MHKNATLDLGPHLAAEMRVEIARRKVKPAHVAEGLGMARSSVTRKLSGDMTLSAADLVRMCRWLDVSVDEIADRAVAHATKAAAS